MTDRQLPADHPPVPAPKVGLLLVNLGSPDAAEPGAVKRYLRQFLSDRRVVEIPAIAWQPILRGIILNTRPKKSAHAYGQVWDRDRDGSPLKLITQDQAAALAERLPDVRVDWAMRYGNPSIDSRLDAMKADGCERICILPMYPQYSAATTATVVDEVGRWMNEQRWQPATRTVAPWYDDPGYVAALAADLSAQIGALDFIPDELVLSFHGMPLRTLALGDAYHCHCQKTARLLADAIETPTRLTFQSRFGRAEWLQPYLDEPLERLPGEGVKRIAVAAPGFTADCLETLEEIALRGKEQFMGGGGERFAYLSCLNAKPGHVEFLADLAKRNLAGWLDIP